MSALIYLLTICLPLGTILLIFGMRYFSTIQQAKLRFANDEAYRLTAEKAAAAEAESAAALKAISTSLADVQGRLAAIERVLKQVE